MCVASNITHFLHIVSPSTEFIDSPEVLYIKNSSTRTEALFGPLLQARCKQKESPTSKTMVSPRDIYRCPSWKT